MKTLESSNGEKRIGGKGKVDSPALVGMTLKVQGEETHTPPGYRVVGTGLVPPEENPKILADMEEGRSMSGREVKGEGEEC